MHVSDFQLGYIIYQDLMLALIVLTSMLYVRVGEKDNNTLVNLINE